MAIVDDPSHESPYIPSFQEAAADLSLARKVYAEATTRADERHAEVGILSADGKATFVRLGKDEPYGTHRVGSVTKTFTAFLALKLVHDGVFANGLNTRCGDCIADEILAKVFEDPQAAREMTLAELLSHTAGLECDDHCYQPLTKAAPLAPASCLQERFLQESTREGGRKYKHLSKPGDDLGVYSNAGVAVAGWMIEAAYNAHWGKNLPFAEIMKQEIFEGVFQLADSFIGRGPTGDIIQSAAGDMSSSTADLMKVASRLQQGQESLERHFGKRWQSLMLAPRDIMGRQGLGCMANASVIKHAGMNREMFGSEERDVTALVQFPLRSQEPGLVAMCDSTALGPAPHEQKFIRALEAAAGISKQEMEPASPKYDLEFFCPHQGSLFHGDSYLATEGDPFSKPSPSSIDLSLNGMKFLLRQDPTERDGYRDQHGKPWLFIAKEDGRKLIYSEYCLLNRLIANSVQLSQPPKAHLQALQGVYQNAEKPEEHSIYTFKERNGHLYLREDKEPDSFPCLFIADPEGADGVWVSSNPTGRKVAFRFPQNPDAEPLRISSILTGAPELPLNCRRISH